MSTTRSESFAANTETSPFVPACTIAAFATTVPVGAFSVEATGCVCPAGHVVKKPRPPCGTAVKFREYAWADVGTLQALERIGRFRVAPPMREGPPNGPGAFRVSAIRQGVIG